MMNLQSYYRTELNVQGTKIPELRKRARSLPLWLSHELSSKAKAYLRTRSFEERYIALFQLGRWVESVSAQEAAEELWTGVWVEGVENWAHSDCFSSLLSRVLDNHSKTEKLYKGLQSWARHSNPWKRRQALIALFYFASTRKQYPAFRWVRSTLSQLCNDSEFYVQRAVGWCLRESFSVYPEQTLTLFENNLLNWSAIAFTTAIEKQKQTDRNKWKKLRRLNRRQSLDFV